MKSKKTITTIKLLLVLTIFSLSSNSFGQVKNNDNTIRVFILKHYGTPSFPFYSKILIDSKEQLKLKNGEYVSIELEKENHMISLPNNEPYSIDGNKSNYYFIILFRKRILWGKHDLIEVTVDYFNSLKLEKYHEYDSQKTKKWY